MPKIDQSFDPTLYAPVADRITLFYQAFPNGRIITDLISRTPNDVVFRARVYRAADDRRAAATGWAAEREGDGEVNAVACLENTETSAIGRALANLGFTASKERASAEEMAKVSRTRLRQVKETVRSAWGYVDSPSSNSLQEYADHVMDVLRLLDRAGRSGIRPARLERWQAALRSTVLKRETLLRIEQRLRAWIRRHRLPRR